MSGKFRKILCTSTIIAGFVLTASAVSAAPKTPSISVPNISPSRPDINLRAPNILRGQNADDDRSSQTKTRKSLKHRKNTHKTTAKKKNVNEKNVGSTGGNSTKVKIPPTKIIPPAVRLNEPGPDIGDRVGKAERARRDAGAAGNLQGNSGAEATMHPAAPTADPLTGGTGIQTLDTMAELCKGENFRRRVQGLGLCAGFQDGSEPVVDPKTGEVHYNTESPVRPGGKYHGPTGFDAARAGDRVPSRGGEASEDTTVTEETGHTREHYTTKTRNADGTYTFATHDVYRDENGAISLEGVSEWTGTDRNNGTLTDTTIMDGHAYVSVELSCTNGVCIHPIHINDQPGDERGQPGGNFRSSFFCLQNPGNPNCQPLKAGFEIDPANPDGEGTPGTRPQTETPRLGRGAVVNPGPTDSEIRGVSGGGVSMPLDMKDPVRPTPPN